MVGTHINFRFHCLNTIALQSHFPMNVSQNFHFQNSKQILDANFFPLSLSTPNIIAEAGYTQNNSESLHGVIKNDSRSCNFHLIIHFQKLSLSLPLSVSLSLHHISCKELLPETSKPVARWPSQIDGHPHVPHQLPVTFLIVNETTIRTTKTQ